MIMELGATQQQGAATSLSLIGTFALLVSGRAVAVPHSVERVIAFLALAGRPVSRSRLAGALWDGSQELQAAKCLRTALWRLHRLGGDLMSTRDDQVALSADVLIDLRDMTRFAQRLIGGPIADEALSHLPALLDRSELLPDWEEEWVVVDRERYRLLRLEALEAAASELLRRHRLSDAVVVANAVVHSEPLRETARRLVLRVQLEQGNIAEALRGYRQYRSLLRKEFGLEPSAAMTRLIEPLAPRRSRDSTVAPI
jgi:DNA-binding SARP family transcriptional activator